MAQVHAATHPQQSVNAYKIMAKLFMIAAAAALALAASTGDAWEPDDWESEEPELQGWSAPPADPNMAVLDLGSPIAGVHPGGAEQASSSATQTAGGEQASSPRGQGGVVDVRLNSELQEGPGKVITPSPTFLQRGLSGMGTDEA
uniref:Uncharacterized protein n=1 Tax=Alexandrium andersonii TaxID=327968 RepID=A0A7S2GMR8_9DINO